MSGEKKFNLYEVMKTVFTKSNASQADIEKIPPFIFRRWLSNHPTGILRVNMFNIFHFVPIDVQYKFMKASLRGKVKYITYPKKVKNNDEEIKILREHFHISEIIARKYYNMYQKTEESKQELEKIINMYKKKGRI